MNKTILSIVGVVTVCIGLYCGARLLAQQPEPRPAQPPAARIGVVNLHAVLKGFKKTKQYDQEVEVLVLPMRKQAEEMKKKIAELKKAIEVRQDKEELEKAMRNEKRQLEDLESEASKSVKKMRERQLVQLYKEVEEGVARVAAAKGFHLVLQFTDPEAREEKYTAENIQRKLAGSAQTGCTVPIYYHPDLDITAAVITNLNAAFDRPQQKDPR